MPLNLHNIQLDPQSLNLLNGNNRFPDLRRVFNRVALDALDIASDYGLAATKSIVPVDTRELRGQTLVDGMIRKSTVTNYTVRVFVTDDAHTGKGHTQSASSLARILNNGVNEKGRRMLRTQNSLSLLGIATVAARRPTAGWISVSDSLFTSGIQRYLNSSLNNRTYT